MDNIKIEDHATELAGGLAEEMLDLNELQLALVGGGIGDVHFG
jgi:hypothetical protein